MAGICHYRANRQWFIHSLFNKLFDATRHPSIAVVWLRFTDTDVFLSEWWVSEPVTSRTGLDFFPSSVCRTDIRHKATYVFSIQLRFMYLFNWLVVYAVPWKLPFHWVHGRHKDYGERRVQMRMVARARILHAVKKPKKGSSSNGKPTSTSTVIMRGPPRKLPSANSIHFFFFYSTGILRCAQAYLIHAE